MKRFLSLLLAIFIILGMTVACSGGDDEVSFDDEFEDEFDEEDDEDDDDDEDGKNFDKNNESDPIVESQPLTDTYISTESQNFTDIQTSTETQIFTDTQTVTDIGVSTESSTHSETVQGVELLAGKTPKELYNETINYIKALTNYEIVIDGSYKYTYYEVEETDEDGEIKESQAPTVEEEKTSMIYKGSDNTFSYVYKSESYEERLIYDGTYVYQLFNNVKERKKISYDDYLTQYGSFVESGVLIELKDSNLDQVRFLPAGELYMLNFTISATDYAELAGGEVNGDVDYKVYFDANGTIVKFERSMEYYYYESILVEDIMVVSFKNIGTVAKITAPADADTYAIRPSAEEIDTSSVDNLYGFEYSDEATNYVLMTFKIAFDKTLDETLAQTGSLTEYDTQISNVTEIETYANDTDFYEGSILIRLYSEVAPETVANFQRLIGQSTYKGMVVNSIIEDFAIQIGEPITDEEEDLDNNVFEPIFGEFASNGFTNNLTHKRGVVSMLRGEDPNSATYDFFICAKDAAELDGYYASFGCVIYGFETIDKIAELEVDSDYIPTVTVTITDTRFLAKK